MTTVDISAEQTSALTKAVAIIVNKPGTIFDIGTEEYGRLTEVFQDAIPHTAINCNQWWFCHWMSSARTCSKCLEVVELFQCGEQTLDQRLQEAILNMRQHHAPCCSVHNKCTFEGLKTFYSLNEIYHETIGRKT